MSFNFCSHCPSVVMATIRPLLSNTNSTTTITFDFWLGVVVLIMKKKRPYIMEEHLSRQQSWAIWRGETRAWRSSWHIAWCFVPLLFTSRSASPSTADPPQLQLSSQQSTFFINFVFCFALLASSFLLSSRKIILVCSHYCGQDHQYTCRNSRSCPSWKLTKEPHGDMA